MRRRGFFAAIVGALAGAGASKALAAGYQSEVNINPTGHVTRATATDYVTTISGTTPISVSGAAGVRTITVNGGFATEYDIAEAVRKAVDDAKKERSAQDGLV